MIKGFRDFILRGNVMDLAVAVIIGGAFTAIVKALTDDLISPLLGAIVGKPEFNQAITIHGGIFKYGAFFTAVIDFLLIAAVVYFFLVIPTQYLMKKFYPAPPAPTTTKVCPECKSDIPIDASRCKFCAQPVAA